MNGNISFRQSFFLAVWVYFETRCISSRTAPPIEICFRKLVRILRTQTCFADFAMLVRLTEYCLLFQNTPILQKNNSAGKRYFDSEQSLNKNQIFGYFSLFATTRFPADNLFILFRWNQIRLRLLQCRIIHLLH